MKKRRTFSLSSLSEKTDIIESAFTEQAAEQTGIFVPHGPEIMNKLLGK